MPKTERTPEQKAHRNAQKIAARKARLERLSPEEFAAYRARKREYERRAYEEKKARRSE